MEQQDSLQENIENLLQLEEEAQKKLKKVKEEINVQKMKGAAVNATTAITDGVSSLLGGSKVKRLEVENENLRQDITELQKQVQAEQREQTKMENRHNSEINKIAQSYRQKITEYDNRLGLIDTYFPIVTEHSRTMPGSGVHRGTDKTDCQPATRREKSAGEREIPAVH